MPTTEARTNVLLPGLKNRGRVRLTVYLDRSTDRILRLIAVENESNVSRVVEEIVREFVILKEKEKQQKAEA